jgi:hypothetical protein
MLVELVHTKTADGLRLDGALQEATAPGTGSHPADAVICLHGVAGNFYGSSLLESVAQMIVGRGTSVLRVNTRGHDGVSTASTDAGGRLQGAAYERVDE